MKRTESYKKIYKIETSDDPEDRGEEYLSRSNDGEFIEELKKICILQDSEFGKMIPHYSFLLHTEKNLIQINVAGDRMGISGSQFNRYQRVVGVHISPGNEKIPRELSDLLNNFGFKKSR